MSLAIISCDTGGFIILVTQEYRLSQYFQAASRLSLLAYNILILHPKVIHQGGCHNSEGGYPGGGGAEAYLWGFLVMNWSVINDGNHSRLSVLVFLEQHHKWSLWDGSIPLQWHTSLDPLQVYYKFACHNLQNTTSIQGYHMGGNSDYWCMESQHGNIFFTQLYLFLGWVNYELD